MFEVVDAPDDLAAESVSLDASGALSVRWSDGHGSVYEAGWLRSHAYDFLSRSERADRLHSASPWESNLLIPTFDYASVMSSNSVLLEWLLAARDLGLTMLTGMPSTDEALENVARRISFIRESNFGVTFEVRTKAGAADSNAYTALELPAHTDLPTRELQPGLQFLHCLINDATGGESTFVDGFAIAATLRAESPEDFRLLCGHPVEFWNKAPQSDYRSYAPIIGLDPRGEVSEIRLANWLRAPFNLPASEMGAFYRAYRRFSALTRDARFIVSRRLEAGQMWCFDNRRTMHARKAFDQASGKRFLRGCYMDRDELLSRILVLQRGEPSRSIRAAL
jgi:gamma-butyrobetaine dioxygenase